MSPLVLIPGFDIIVGCPVDYMHCVLLGITNLLLRLWFDTKNHFQPFYIGRPNQVKAVNKNIEMIHFHKTITRRPRPIDDRSFYKASEFLNFLLYYGGACVEGILPQKYLNHFNLLSSAVFTFSKDSFSSKEFATAEKKLDQFHAEFSQLYKEKNLVYNTHLLTHIPNCVKNWGPAWTFSNFPFEDYNGVLKNFVSFFFFFLLINLFIHFIIFTILIFVLKGGNKPHLMHVSMAMFQGQMLNYHVECPY